jgi:hypothetical protein
MGFVVVNRAETGHFAEAGGHRAGRQRPGCGGFGDWVEDAPDQQGEVAAAIAVGAEDAVKADLASGAESGGDVTVGQAVGDGKGVVLCETLEPPDNVVMIALPPTSPKSNPVENMSAHLRANKLCALVWDNYDAIIEA